MSNIDRTQELQAIDEYISQNGVYRCRMGEMFYEEEPSLRQRMLNQWKNRKKPTVVKPCGWCGENMHLPPHLKDRKYCCQECAGQARTKIMSKKQTHPCTRCGKLHVRRRNQCKNPKAMFCSADCSNKYRVGK